MLLNLDEDDIDDLLYLARTNDVKDLQASIGKLPQSHNVSSEDIITSIIDPVNGNSLLHMASANGCIAVLHFLLLSSPESEISRLDINLQNSSGNTPLHWAALNGHLEAVKMLVNAGADPSIKNATNHDAVYEAENNGKDEVVSWLLLEGKGLETGVKGAKEEESDVKEASHDDEERELKEKEAVSIAEAENGLKDLDPKGREEGRGS
ncbi:MAG: hypothetical protein Q9190_007058 [Brigantiaea leucoxantha]